ncbi:MAG: DUF3102 domain-containing protein [Oscillospiraceae bacterium]|nr:DUF3102 domain-containing protein [Oscillospiraceae bacterium]MDY5736508.1 DUF3102 domain-containing protein [Oscillospiraceae bacterium]
MGELVRSIDTVTAEIVMIRENAKKVFFDAVIQIGTRLEEAKSLVPQGEWLNYLENCLGYKPSTAQNYMKIAREMGSGQVGLDGKTAGELFGRLGYSQLLPLIGVSAEERQEIAENNELEGMSAREVKKLVDDYKKAQAAAEHADQRAMDANRALEKAEKRREEAEQAEADAEAARKAAEDRAGELEVRVEELLRAAKEQPIEAACEVLPSEEEVARIRAEVQTELAGKLEEAEERLRRAKTGSAQKAAIYFAMLGDTWENLRAALDALRTEDPGTADKFIGAVMDQLSDIAGELNEMEGDS